ncbi:MAG TPA: tRNA guanosine(34) transglycosylase Tgt, partial [Pyrinomonadaceae bacterium]|nr:tRNA guanosine(34) transglycosylase Tgt [Pyrinomonadaceae bacterium]
MNSIETQSIGFDVQAREGEARAGILTTQRGQIETPVFMPIGTAGTVKGIRFEELEAPDLDARIILGNTYHLWLRPGIEVIKACGGLHNFIGWERAMLTDSGGFQVWSLTDIRKVTEEGTEFRSHIDGALCFLSPEISMEVQTVLGAEIAMAFDECPPGQIDHDAARRSMELTLRWAKRSKEAHVTQVGNLRSQELESTDAQVNNLCYMRLLRSLRPTQRQLHAAPGRVMIDLSRWALVEGHGDLGAERGLHFHRNFGREKTKRPVDVRAKLSSLFGDFANFCETPNLKASRVGEHRA